MKRELDQRVGIVGAPEASLHRITHVKHETRELHDVAADCAVGLFSLALGRAFPQLGHGCQPIPALSSAAMAEKPTWEQIECDRDEAVQIPLDPEEALRALLKVDPESEPVATDGPQQEPRPSRQSVDPAES